MKIAFLIIVTTLLIAAPASARPVENHSGYVSTTQVRHDAAALAVKIARQDGARHAQVTTCHHLRQSAVDCNARLTFVDPEDGWVSVVRYVVHGIATYGGRWAVIVPAPSYSTGLLLP